MRSSCRYRRLDIPGGLWRAVALPAVVCLVLALAACPLSAAGPVPETTSPPAPLILEEVPELLVPSEPRTQEEQDRLEALALFAAGRMKEHEQDYDEALRLYQRALRYHPKALPVLEQIVPLAFQLNRPQEAVRYALMAVEIDPSNPLLLRRLGMHLAQEGNWQGALELYEKALKLEKGEKSAASVVLNLEMGRLYFLTGRHDQAADVLLKVFDALERLRDYGIDERLEKELFKERETVYDLIGDALLEAGRIDQAIAAYNKRQETKGDKPLLAWQLARVHAKKDEPAEALKHLEAYIASGAESQGTGPYELLAEVLKELGKPDELIPRLEKARQDQPRNAPLGYFLASRYLGADKLDQAEALLRSLHDEAPTADSYQGLAVIYRQRRAAGPLLKLLGQGAAETGGLEVLGDEAQAILEDPQLVDDMLAAADKQYQDDADKLDFGARLAAALVALQTERFEPAGKFFERAIEAEPKQKAEVLLLWGIGMLSAEKHAEAAAVFQRGIDEQVVPSDNPAFHFYLSAALELAGRTDEALAAARKAAEIAPDAPRMHSRVAWVLYHAGRHDEAIAAYTELIERFDGVRGSAEVREVLREARLVLSNLYVIKKDLPRAEEWLEQVLDEFPDDPAALNDLGYLWADQGKNLERALEMTRKAVEADPDNAAYRDSLGWALYKLGRYQEAVEELKKATAGDDPDGVILDHLGDAWLKLGDKQQAVAAWQRALEAFDAEEQAEDIERVREKLQSNR